MTCVILPSETARLVYGYLVKENLKDIALQFLEASPYLTDCCQVNKSGYQFNTKLMGKDLQDLLQEYSTIHNLVNKKVNHLSKTSLLYKRVKLRCETISEILDLILFWKCKNLETEENNVTCEKVEKSTSSFLCSGNNEVKSTCDDNNSSVRTLNIGSNNNLFCNESNDASALQSNDNDVSENVDSKVSNETFVKDKNLIDNESNSDSRSEKSVLEQDTRQEKTLVCVPAQVTEISEDFQKSAGENNIGNVSNDINEKSNNCNIPISNASNSAMPDLCLDSNILTMSMESQRKELVSGEVENMPSQSNEETLEYENQMKIVQIEKEKLDENHSIDVYSVPAAQNKDGVALENGSVVYMGQEVSDITMDEDRNQIIVIPIDYYKPQNDHKDTVETDGSQKEDFFHAKEIIVQDKSDVIFEDVETAGGSTNSMNQFYSEGINKPLSVDDNILTESDFLKNKHLMYSLETELKKPQAETPRVEPSREVVPSPATPVIVLSQTVIPAKPRFRSILPKRKKISRIPPVVVVQPLLESNQEVAMKLPNRVKPAKREVAKKIKAKEPSVRKSDSTDVENLETPVSDRNDGEAKSDESQAIVQTTEKSVESQENVNEEKENLKKFEMEKKETPVFRSRRNCKRQSMSTPRRRTHIRALEFETPPKKKEEKKSRTSPKAKVEKAILERKTVRNTLFKSPMPEESFKSQGTVEGSEFNSRMDEKVRDESESELPNEFSIPIATRSPNVKLSDAWENLTGVGCVIGSAETSKPSRDKKMWDADLRGFISDTSLGVEPLEKKRVRKTDRGEKDNRKSVRKKGVVKKKTKPAPATGSPSKMSLTAKRNTYCINGNEDGSPIKSLLDDLKIVTPFKDVETTRPTEETPLTKLLRENINTIDIDLSMINTPSFPPTPSIVVTPDLGDVSLVSGANYYSPTKDSSSSSKEKVVQITDYFRVDVDGSNKKENHDKVIDDLVSKAREIIGITKESPENSSSVNRPSGKILSMVKIQMLSQCDKKLCENIPINEEANFTTAAGPMKRNDCSSLPDEGEPNKLADLKGELEEKRRRAVKKIKENLSPIKGQKYVKTRMGRKRKRSGSTIGSRRKSQKSKSDVSGEGAEENVTGTGSGSPEDKSDQKKVEIFHSTPKDAKKSGTNSDKTNSILKSVGKETLTDIRDEFPPFQDFDGKYGELAEKSRKKIYYIEQFLKLPEIAEFLKGFEEANPPKLHLKPSLETFFQIFHKWLKHPRKRESNSFSAETKLFLRNHLSAFDKINRGLNRGRCSKRSRKDREEGEPGERFSGSKESTDPSGNKSGNNFSDEKQKEKKESRGSERKKDDDAEDGFVSILPLKKRKSTVQQAEAKAATTSEKNDSKNGSAETATRTQNFLQDIDVDRFLFQIHGKAKR